MLFFDLRRIRHTLDSLKNLQLKISRLRSDLTNLYVTMLEKPVTQVSTVTGTADSNPAEGMGLGSYLLWYCLRRESYAV